MCAKLDGQHRKPTFGGTDAPLAAPQSSMLRSSRHKNRTHQMYGLHFTVTACPESEHNVSAGRTKLHTRTCVHAHVSDEMLDARSKTAHCVKTNTNEILNAR